MSGRAIGIVGALAAVAVTCGCELDDRSVRAVFLASGTPPTTDRVRLAGAGIGADRARLDVVIDGWTTSGDVFAFNFGLVVEPPGALQLIPGSLEIGPALAEAGCAAPIGLASPQADGLTVGVTKIGPCDGHSIGPHEQTIVSFDLRLVAADVATIRFGPSGPNDPSALDSLVAPIRTIDFDPEPASVAVW